MLVSTSAIRSWLGLASADTGPNDKLKDLSNAVQEFVETTCSRKFEAKLYKTDPANCYFDGTGQYIMLLPQFPVWYVNEVNVDADRDFGSATQIATDDIILYEARGQIVSQGGVLSKNKRNVYVEYYAGYAAGTHNSHDGLGTIGFAVPNDLKQVIVEMVAQSFREGITAVHTVDGEDGGMKFVQMLNNNSMWHKTINSYKKMDVSAEYGFYIA